MYFYALFFLIWSTNKFAINIDKIPINNCKNLFQVPILGASKVIGKNRRKVFANGYPGKVTKHFYSFYLFNLLKTFSSLFSNEIKILNTIELLLRLKYFYFQIPESAKLDEKSEKRRLVIQQKREERKLQMELRKKEKGKYDGKVDLSKVKI